MNNEGLTWVLKGREWEGRTELDQVEGRENQVNYNMFEIAPKNCVNHEFDLGFFT